MGNVRCPKCGQEVENKVLYQCVRCFTVYCSHCEDSRSGRVCPKCGMSPRLILGQNEE